MSDHLIHFKTFMDPYEAEIARSLLEANNIPAFVENSHANSTMPHLQFALNGTRVMILSDDLQSAIEVFKNHSFASDVKKDKPWVPRDAGGLFRGFLSFLIIMLTAVPVPLKKKNKDAFSR